MRKKHCEVVSNKSHLTVDIQSVIRSKKSIKQWAYILHDKDEGCPDLRSEDSLFFIMSSIDVGEFYSISMAGRIFSISLFGAIVASPVQ